MSFSFGSSKQKSSSNEQAQSDPWDVATPYIKDFLRKDIKPMIGTSRTKASPDMMDAYGQLRENAQAGNPYAGSIDNLTRDLFGAESYAPQVGQAYGDFSRRMTPTADGANLDLESNPYIRDMLAKVSGDAMTGVNELFAGAGRSFSGAHAGALGKAVTEAQLPTLANLYQYETGRTDAAGRDLMTQGSAAASTQQALDQQAAALRSMGIDTSKEALAAENWGPNTIIEIENQLRAMPAEQAARIAAILFPAGGLGQQTEGSGTSTAKKSGFSIGGSLFGGG